jgi:hypothetical protein
MKKFFGLTLGVLILAGSALAQEAQDYPKAEISAGYSYLRLGSGGVNQHGGSVSIAGNLNRWFGIAGDFGGYHAAGLNTFTFLAGPRFTARSDDGIIPFAQVLVGGAHVTASAGGFSAAVTPFAISAGGGLDVSMTRSVALRPQVDYIAMRSNGSTVNTIRASVGIVFQLGGKK